MAIHSEDDFRTLEEDWRHRLIGRSLVVESDIDPELAIEALAVLGDNLMGAVGERRPVLYVGVPR